MAFQLRPDRDLTVLIPARAGSKRIPGKNTKRLGGKPLIQWTIDAAKAANVARIIVSSDDDEVHTLSDMASCCWHRRKPAHASDASPDIEWVLDLLAVYERVMTPYIAICRPTSPFRTASTIRRGYAAFIQSKADSLRAVKRVTYPHPGKMWVERNGLIEPIMPQYYVINQDLPVPYHSMPTQLLPRVYTQTASLEIASVAAITRTQTISGDRVKPFFCEPLEQVDLNTPEDWAEAERLIASGRL